MFPSNQSSKMIYMGCPRDGGLDERTGIRRAFNEEDERGEQRNVALFERSFHGVDWFKFVGREEGQELLKTLLLSMEQVKSLEKDRISGIGVARFGCLSLARFGWLWNSKSLVGIEGADLDSSWPDPAGHEQPQISLVFCIFWSLISILLTVDL